MIDITPALQSLPWVAIVISTLAAIVGGGLWYGLLCKHYFQLSDGKEEIGKGNWVGIIIQLLSFFALALLVSVLLQLGKPLFLLGVIGFALFIFLASLSGRMFHFGNDNRRALALTSIVQGYEVIAIFVIAWVQYLFT